MKDRYFPVRRPTKRDSAVYFLLICGMSLMLSCSEQDGDPGSLLFGTWHLKTKHGYSQESLTFSPDGTYEIVNYGYYLGLNGNSVQEKALLEGNFEWNGETITFLTAEIEFYEGAELDKTLLSTSGSTIGSFYGYDLVGIFPDTNYVVKSILALQDYESVSWEIIELTSDVLRVRKDANVFEYEAAVTE